MSRAETTAGPTVPGTRVVDGVLVPDAGTWVIDPSHTTVGFVARHLGLARVRGRLPDVAGEVHIAERPEDSSVHVRIGTATLDTRDEGRDKHLRSPEFFDVSRYPAITFRSTGLRRDGDGWLLDGDLTIRDVTRPVTLEVEFEGVAADPWDGGVRAGFSASTEVQRDDWGLRWDVPLESGGFLVGRRILIQLDVELIRQ